MANPRIRKGEGPGHLTREAFGERFRAHFFDSLYDPERAAIARLEEIAWRTYEESRKAPVTRRAGDEFADPSYELSVDWLTTRAKLAEASATQGDPASASRVLVVTGAARNDDTCPHEVSKTWRLAGIARAELETRAGFEVDFLDLSLLTSEYGRTIHPCKGCVSTAMPLCHWPCSCYPNHSLDQVNDAMAEIYECWVRAHGVLLVTPVYWYQSPSPLKLMIDRLVCADGGNPDPTSTGGKDPEKAKQVELDGWPQASRRSRLRRGRPRRRRRGGEHDPCALRLARLDGARPRRLVGQAGSLHGYYEPYATSHETLDRDTALQEEVRNVARALATAVSELRSGELLQPDRGLRAPRPK